MAKSEKKCDSVLAKSTEGAYLFVYFVGNDPDEERIHFAVSRDGYNFEPLNGDEEVIVQTKGTLSMRDPYILKGTDGFYYIIATDMRSIDGWTSNHALITWRSENLVDWTDETVIDIRDFGGEYANTNRAWAPQAIWDEKRHSYMVYWATSTVENDVAAMYYAHTTDFKTMTRPTLMYAREGIQTIDGDIVYNENNKKYYLYFKHDEDQTIAYVTADELTGPYVDPPVVVSLADSGVEGSEMYRITGTDTWIMMMDEYGKGRFIAQQTQDMENFVRLPDNVYSYGKRPRHGSVIAISDSEYDALVKAFGK
ncbi:MAG: glycoside hydrolase family 43 protein [Clostridia bacterium]|nr:glycoside hydrolase family 43 protein [Clostridia bacterium]